MSGMTARGARIGILATLLSTLLVAAPTAGDFGLTWDEPAYRYSQQISSQWWGRLFRAAASGSRDELAAILTADALLYYWPYGRHGINFHPPLGGQMNLLTYTLLGGFLKDIPARRMASVFELAGTAAILFGFLGRRYGPWAAAVAAGSLVLMPRVYGDAHIAGTDMPGLLLWSAAALAFWKGLHEEHARRWRVLVGILAGLAFVEKMAAVFVVGPLLLWLVVARLPRTFRRGGRADWGDGLATTAAMLAPLALAFSEILRLSRLEARINGSPQYTRLYALPTAIRSGLPGAILLLPLLAWMIRRLLGRWRRDSRVWGPERPALETWTAILAFAPAVGWMGNPAWWRETLVRLAHYYGISTGRRGVLPDIQIYYFGQTYEFTLPWHNGWVLTAITVPATILVASCLGLAFGLSRTRSDRLPLFFLLQMAVLPVTRMLPTPAHDGVRLMLPTFFFLAGFAGWGASGVADVVARLAGAGPAAWPRALVAALVLGPAGWQLARVHPFELSYYNEFIGGPAGAWKSGFELTYWYDAFTPGVIREINGLLPGRASVDFRNEKSITMTFQELQALGELRPDINSDTSGTLTIPHAWLLTNDSKATALTKLLFAMRPLYEHRPRQLGGLRVASVAGPDAVARAQALQVLLDAPADRPRPAPTAPAWAMRLGPVARLWGVGLTPSDPLGINDEILGWARDDPEGLRAAARAVASGATATAPEPPEMGRLRQLIAARPQRFRSSAHSLGIDDAHALSALLARYDEPGKSFSGQMLALRPMVLAEAVETLILRADAIRVLLSRYGYTDEAEIGGYLDRAP